MRQQRQKQHEKLHAYTNDNEKLKVENRKMKNTLKQKDKKSKDEINQLKAKLRKVEREARSSNQTKDKETENAIHLAETQVRMALEEKLNEMWQPAEVLNRIASFIDSGTGASYSIELLDFELRYIHVQNIHRVRRKTSSDMAVVINIVIIMACLVQPIQPKNPKPAACNRKKL